MKIIIIEDDEMLLDFIEKLFTRWGHTVLKFLSGKKAIRMMPSDIDLVLLDIFLQDAMGYDLIPQIKSLSPEAKIITMTGMNCRDLENRVRSLGILYYMIKPIEIEHLKTIIDHIEQKKDKEAQKTELEAIND